MPLWMFEACLGGYQEHTTDILCMTVFAGYYSGYYSNTKRPKPPSEVIRKILKTHTPFTAKESEHSSKEQMSRKVNTFEARRERFLQKGVRI